MYFMCYNNERCKQRTLKNNKFNKNLGVAQLVERYLGVVEAARSNRVTQTRKDLNC